MIVNDTDMLYMDDIEGCYYKQCEAQITGVNADDKGRTFIVLNKSIFYPEGGGQPTDTGMLQWMDPSSHEQMQVKITRVSKKQGIRHYIDDTAIAMDLKPGMNVNAILDWERRYAHMKMHTAQHLLSAIVYNMHGALTVGNQIHAESSRIDFSPLGHDEVDVEKIERECNAIIGVNPPVKVFFEKRSKIEALPDADRCNVKLIPEWIQELRIVKIQDVELCPCAGTHIKNLQEVGALKIMNVRSKGKGKVRITYELGEP